MTSPARTAERVELERMIAVRKFEILDTPPDGAFDRIAAVAARTFDVPIGIVSIVDTDRIWFKAKHGVTDVEEIDREPGLCASAILHDGPWIVSDARADPRALTNSLVAGEFGLRFYAGVPLTTSEGHNFGTLCVLDTKPREVSERELQTLTDLAHVVVEELELRLAARETVHVESQLRREAEHLARALQSSLLPPRPPGIAGMELATRYIPGDRSVDIGGDFFDVFRLAANDWALVLGDACGKGPQAASVAALARWSVRAAAVHHFDPDAVLRDLNAVLIGESGDADDRFCTVAFARLELDTCGAWITLASCGHPLPMLLRASGVVEERGRAGLPVGLFDTVTPINDRVGLGPGDALVFFTDGITETRDATGDLYGENRLRDLLATLTGQSADLVADAIVQEAQRFGTVLRDDVAVVVLRVPDDLGDDPLARVIAATGIAAEDLRLPDYPHGGHRPDEP
jgi:sigma-B regulation protein RsbU (phosphoserine phosphatase)